MDFAGKDSNMKYLFAEKKTLFWVQKNNTLTTSDCPRMHPLSKLNEWQLLITAVLHNFSLQDHFVIWAEDYTFNSCTVLK